MSETSRNWDFSRLAYMDIVIMQIAIAELLNFPTIPISVTINEYVDMAKRYSTPKSGGYINGMLDAIARHLIDTGKLLKQMPEKLVDGQHPRQSRANGYAKPVRFVHKPKTDQQGENMARTDEPTKADTGIEPEQ